MPEAIEFEFDDVDQDQPVDEEPGKPGEPEPKGAGKAETVTRAEYEALLARLDAALAPKPASRVQEPAPEPAPPEYADYDRSEDAGTFADDLASKGMEALVKRGLVTERKAAEMVRDIVSRELAAERRKMARDAETLGKYPELAQPDSPVRARTVEILREMVAEDPEIERSGSLSQAALRVAAMRARAEAGEGSGGDTERKIRAAAGERSRGAGQFGGESPSLSPLTQMFLQKVGVTQDSFEKSRERLGSKRRAS